MLIPLLAFLHLRPVPSSLVTSYFPLAPHPHIARSPVLDPGRAGAVLLPRPADGGARRHRALQRDRQAPGTGGLGNRPDANARLASQQVSFQAFK